MYKLILKCRVITPMFMAGADGRTPELRPSEFKGMMRWWWRAIKAENNIKKLKEDEAKIFGGTGEGEGKSKVQLRITGSNSLLKGNNLKNDYHLEWDYNKNTKSLVGKHAGIGYLLYSTVLPKRERAYIKDGYEFELTLISVDEEAFKKACASLWLAIHLGGFGTRARRGGGNIELTEVNKNTNINLDFICNAKDPYGLKEFLEKNLNEIKNEIKEIYKTNTSSVKPEYTSLKGGKILIFEPKNNWKEVLNLLGNAYKDFRSRNKSQIFELAAFGMPVMHSSFSVRMVPYDNDSRRVSERWASPLIFKVIKSSNNLYFPVILKLSAGGVNYIGREEKRNNRWNIRDVRNFTEQLINKFLNNLSQSEELVL